MPERKHPQPVLPPPTKEPADATVIICAASLGFMSVCYFFSHFSILVLHFTPASLPLIHFAAALV